MQILNAGEYTGEINQRIHIDDCIITNTSYSNPLNNPQWHYHENLHICFVFQGGKAETKTLKQYTEREGNLFFYHAEEQHRWTPSQPVSKSANIEIGPNFLETYGLTQEEVRKSIDTHISAKSLILKMQKEMLENSRPDNTSIHILLLELLSFSKKYQGDKKPAWTGKLKELLHENWNQELSLPEIANLLNVHPVTISKYFRKYFFCTYSEYRSRLKIDQSIDLIKNSSFSLSEIAFHCQFSDQSHFIRNFKKRTGFLPKDFRKY